MSRISLSVACLLGTVFTVSCAPGDGDGKPGTVSSGSAAAAVGGASETPGSSGGGGVKGVGGGGMGAVLDGSTGGSSASSSGGSDLTGGAANPGGGAGSAGTGAVAPGGKGGGETTDPNPFETGGIAGGTTTDPGDDDTTDPGDDDTTDPGDDDTTDPGDDDTTDPGDDDTTDPGDDDTTDPGDDDTKDPPDVDECIPTEMTNVNVIVFEDAEPSGADSEGRMYVGGDANLSGYAVGSQEALDCTRWDLVVGGDLTVSGGSVSNGKVAVGGTYTQVSAFTTACGIYEDETPVDFEALEAEMIAYSQEMAAYPTNGDAEISNGTLYLTGTDPKLNVFSVTATELDNNVDLDVPEGSSVIVNVSGTEVLWSGKGFALPDGGRACRGDDTDWCHSIMYNMYEATTLEIAGIGVQGSILAPYATFTGNGGNVDGQLVVQYLYGGIEFHPYFFSGCLLLPEVEGSV